MLRLPVLRMAPVDGTQVRKPLNGLPLLSWYSWLNELIWMAKTKPVFDDFLTVGTRAELRTAIARSGMALSLPQAQRLVAHATSLEPAVQSLRLGIIHTYTSELLDPWLALAASLQGLELHTYHAPYGVTLQEAREDSGLVAHQPDLTLLMLRREDLHPALAKPLARLSAADQAQLGDEVLDRLCGIVARFGSLRVGQIVLTLLPSLLPPGLGIYDAQSESSESIWWARLKAAIGRCLRETMQASLLVDLDELLQQVGRARFFDYRIWYSARFPFTAEAANSFAQRVIDVGALLKFPKAKVIALDADNTLWGGIIGEDGITGIALGPEYPGNAFVDFQRRLLEYQQRGFILALCSKNNPADVDQVLKEHPHQILRDEHFAARRVNWLPKVDNLISLADELNLGLDSFIFVDDSDHECAAVRHRFPQVEVVQTPARPVDMPACLEHVARLEVMSLTVEDLAKTELYAQERRRREFREAIEHSGAGRQDYLASLKMKMRISLNARSHVVRLSQLTQKTNQFNLTTRRYDEHQMQEFVLDANWLVADFSLADIFGDSGIVGLALFRMVTAQRAELDTLLMSCRVIGRKAEAAFLDALLRYLAECGIEEIAADYIPTLKNILVKSFLPEQGFEKCAEGGYRRHLHKAPPQPESAHPITVELMV
ncbi:MAG: HAD-IIIC family phosphatase [Candidatus Competibacter sp.]|nr:HAD-IIIC family phosphatase [Candidatus Competibacter sp.]